MSSGSWLTEIKMFNVYLQKQNTSHLIEPDRPLPPLPLLPTPLLPHPLHVREIQANSLPLAARMHTWQIIGKLIIEFVKMFQWHGPPTLQVGPHAVPVDPWDNPFDKGAKQHFYTLWLWVTRTVSIFCPHHSQQKQLKKCSHTLSCQATPGLLSSLVHAFGLSFQMGPLLSHARPQKLFSSSNIHVTG